MSQRPWRASKSFATCATCFLSATSSGVASTSPNALSCFSAARSLFSVLPEMTTRAPACASSDAPASPIPEPPPVIHATLPLSILRGAEQDFLLLLGHFGTAAVSENGQRLLHRRALEQSIAPALERGILVDFHSLALGKAQPGHGRHVGDGVFVAGEVFRLLQAPVDHHVEPVGLVLVAVHRVRNFLRRVAEEM